MALNPKYRDPDPPLPLPSPRSAYGDMHAHREAQLMKEHITLLQSAHIIDETTAIELLKPLDKKRKWPASYLSALPTYTGIQPAMETFETAEKHRRTRDAEMLQIVSDYEAGIVDLDGVRIACDSDEITNADESVELSPSVASIEPSPSVDSIEPSPLRSPPTSLPAAERKRKRKRSRPVPVTPLAPLPGGNNYAGYNYNQLAAVGRERQIYTPGSAQGVRNALIQDDYNVRYGLARDVAWWKGKIGRYKIFKTGVPLELREEGE